MFAMGTIVNVAAIVVAGIFGKYIGKYLTDRYQDTLTKAMGICTIFLGIGGTIEKMMSVNGEVLSSHGSLMMILALTFGALIGEFIDIDGKMEQFGEYLKNKTGNSKDGKFVNGFVTASLTVCIGAMAIVGSINDGIYHDPSTLYAKSILDFVIILVMSSSLGKGCGFSAIPVGILQGGVTILASFIQPVLTVGALNCLSYVGNMLITCVGINLIWPKTVKVANLLPAVIFAVLFSFIPFLN